MKEIINVQSNRIFNKSRRHFKNASEIGQNATIRNILCFERFYSNYCVKTARALFPGEPPIPHTHTIKIKKCEKFDNYLL